MPSCRRSACGSSSRPLGSVADPRRDRVAQLAAEEAADAAGDAPGCRTETRPGLGDDIPGTAGTLVMVSPAPEPTLETGPPTGAVTFLTTVPTPRARPGDGATTVPVTFLTTVPTVPRPPGRRRTWEASSAVPESSSSDWELVGVGERVGPVVGAGWMGRVVGDPPGWVVGDPLILRVAGPPRPAATPAAYARLRPPPPACATRPGRRPRARCPPGLPSGERRVARSRGRANHDLGGRLEAVGAAASRGTQRRRWPARTTRAAPTTIEPAVPSPARYARVARTCRHYRHVTTHP